LKLKLRRRATPKWTLKTLNSKLILRKEITEEYSIISSGPTSASSSDSTLSLPLIIASPVVVKEQTPTLCNFETCVENEKVDCCSDASSEAELHLSPTPSLDLPSIHGWDIEDNEQWMNPISSPSNRSSSPSSQPLVNSQSAANSPPLGSPTSPSGTLRWNHVQKINAWLAKREQLVERLEMIRLKYKDSYYRLLFEEQCECYQKYFGIRGMQLFKEYTIPKRIVLKKTRYYISESPLNDSFRNRELMN
jgi:hypothetical protein